MKGLYAACVQYIEPFLRNLIMFDFNLRFRCIGTDKKYIGPKMYIGARIPIAEVHYTLGIEITDRQTCYVTSFPQAP